jgi:hypothetical protein
LAARLLGHCCRTPDRAKAHPAFLVNAVLIALGVVDGFRLFQDFAVFKSNWRSWHLQIIFPAFLPKIRS